MLHIQSLAKQFGSKTLFENADAFIGQRSRVGLIGPNGAGKSTLIKMIMGDEVADEGQIVRASHLAIGHLPQEIPKMSGRTILEEAMRLDGRREELLKAKADYERLFEKESRPQDLERYGRIVEEVEHLNEYTLESRAKAVLGGMGFKPSDFERRLAEFSGGWLMRVALSRILIMDPDLLLLDEPTNHLDLESLLWLEEFLQRQRGAMLIISHDTAFLNRLVNEVFEIDQKKIWSYKGNLDSYAVQKEERMKVLRAQYEGQQNKIAHIEAFVSRFGAKATKARQAQSKLKQLEKMKRIELPDDRQTVKFRFPPVPHSGKEIVTVEDASLKFGERTLFRDLNWQIKKGSRVAIVGVNGAGKTTLLKMIAKVLDPSSGQVKLGHEVKVGYYSQMQAETLDLKNTILKELESVAPDMPVAQVRAIAGAFLFSGDAVEKRCGVLSGGEKARVALAKLLLSPSNFLLLDEPTNHLDVESRGVLLDALADYEGTLCLVSHDREFVQPLVTSVLEIEPSPEGSEVIHSTSTYEEYLQRKIREASNQLSGVDEPKADKKPQTESGEVKKTPSNNQKKSWERELKKTEEKITKLEEIKTRIDTSIADPDTYNNKEKLMKLLNEQRENGAELEAAYSKWEELSNNLAE